MNTTCFQISQKKVIEEFYAKIKSAVTESVASHVTDTMFRLFQRLFLEGHFLLRLRGKAVLPERKNNFTFFSHNFLSRFMQNTCLIKR